MGLFYTNFVLRGPNQAQVGEYLAHLGRTAYISPTVGDIIVVYDRECDEQDEAVLAGLAEALSRHFRCPTLAAYLHDDDVFWYCLYRDGRFLEEYNSTPNYFDQNATERLPPSGGDAALLCSLFNAPDCLAEVDRLLHYFVPGDEPSDQPFPEDRHVGICDVLGFPPFATGMCYHEIVKHVGEETVLAQGFIKVAPAA